MGNELVVEKSWWKKNWKWFLPTLTLIFFLLFWLILSLSIDGNVTDIAKAYSENSLYEKAIEKAKTNQRVLIIDENGKVETIQKTPFPRPLRYARTLAQNCILCTQRASTIKNLESKKFNWRLFHLTTSGSSATSIYLNNRKNRSVCNPATGN